MRCAQHLLAQCLAQRRSFFSPTSWSLSQTHEERSCHKFSRVYLSWPLLCVLESFPWQGKGCWEAAASWDKGEGIFKVCTGQAHSKNKHLWSFSKRPGQQQPQRQGLGSWFIRSWSPSGGRQGVGLEGERRAKASWLSSNKVNIAPDVCPGVEAISSSLPAHFIFQN